MTSTDIFAQVPDAPRSDNALLLENFAADLHSAGFGHESITSFLGESTHEALMRDQLVPALRRIEAEPAPTALGTMLGLFMLGIDADTAEVASAFAATGLEGLQQLGVAEPVEGSAQRWQARLDLRPHASDTAAEIWVASDLGAHQRPGVLRHDHVLGIGQASLTLAQTTIRPHVDRALDLGTGCGIQLFHLLAHCRRVVATDISARALGFTRFNLLLNHQALGIDAGNLAGRVELRLGSLLEPVAGEHFDLVVSNPPFVITPRGSGAEADERFTYRDGGMPGDSLVAHLVSSIPKVLKPGGSAQLLANWEITAAPVASLEPEWSSGPRSWLRGDTEAWFIQREAVSPGEYAETWLRDASQGRDQLGFAKQYGAYLDDFASRGVESIGFGFIWLRTPKDGARGFGRVFETIGYQIEQPIGPYLGRDIAVADGLEGRDTGGLYLVAGEDVTEERHQRPGAEHPGVILLRQGAGLRRTEILDTALAGFVSACDGDLDVSSLVGALESLLTPEDPEFSAKLHEGVVRLVKRGFLLEMRNNR